MHGSGDMVRSILQSGGATLFVCRTNQLVFTITDWLTELRKGGGKSGQATL
jgi:hypothetical protein